MDINNFIGYAMGMIDEKGIHPAPAVFMKGERTEIVAMDLSPELLINKALEKCADAETTEIMVSIDSFCRSGQGTTYDSCLIIFHVIKHGTPKVGVMEYKWEEDETIEKAIVKDVVWDNEFWNNQYADLCSEFQQILNN